MDLITTEGVWKTSVLVIDLIIVYSPIFASIQIQKDLLILLLGGLIKCSLAIIHIYKKTIMSTPVSAAEAFDSKTVVVLLRIWNRVQIASCNFYTIYIV